MNNRVNYVIARCDGLPRLDAGLPPDLRACAPRMWAAAEGIVAEVARAEGGMDGLRFRLWVSWRALTARAWQLTAAGLPARAGLPAAHVAIEFSFVDDRRGVVLFVPRALGVPPHTSRLTRLLGGEGGEPRLRACQTCGACEGLRACPACRAVWYCGRECRLADWHVHRGVCREMI